MQVVSNPITRICCLTSDCNYCYNGYCINEAMNNEITFASNDTNVLIFDECQYYELDYEKYSKICILEAVDSPDRVLAKSIVKYQVKGKNFISFALSSYEKEERGKIIQELENNLPEMNTFPLWSDLSESLFNIITKNEFDMYFIEDKDISAEEQTKLLLEASKHKSLDSVVDDGSLEECAIIIYAGAMCQINWYGSVYGVCKLSDII